MCCNHNYCIGWKYIAGSTQLVEVNLGQQLWLPVSQSKNIHYQNEIHFFWVGITWYRYFLIIVNFRRRSTPLPLLKCYMLYTVQHIFSPAKLCFCFKSQRDCSIWDITFLKQLFLMVLLNPKKRKTFVCGPAKSVAHFYLVFDPQPWLQDSDRYT